MSKLGLVLFVWCQEDNSGKSLPYPQSPAKVNFTTESINYASETEQTKAFNSTAESVY
jgi:hypothetical protein